MMKEYYVPVVGLSPELSGELRNQFIIQYLKEPRLASANDFLVTRKLTESTFDDPTATYFALVKIRLVKDSSDKIKFNETAFTLQIFSDDAIEILDIQISSKEALRERERITRTDFDPASAGSRETERDFQVLPSSSSSPSLVSSPVRNGSINSSDDAESDESTPLIDHTNPYHTNIYRRIVRRYAGLHYLTDPVSQCFNHLSISSQSRLSYFIKGLQFYFFVLWPAVFWPMYLHDVIVYGSEPSNRYGNTFWKMLVGHSRNQLTLTGMLGNDLAGEGNYWAFLPLMLFPIVTGAIGMFLKKHSRYANAKYPNESLEALRANSPFYQSLLPKISDGYMLWAHGYPASKNPVIKYASELPFLLLNLAIYYADYRLAFMIFWKFINAFQTLHKKVDCANDKKVFKYLSAYGDYVCGVCPDWDFVYAGDVFTSQGCVDGLLAEGRSPEFISKHLKQLLKRAKPYFENIDFSRQSWRNWTNTEWEDVLDQISFKLDRLFSFDLSRALPDDSYLDYGKLYTLFEFSKNVPFALLDMHNQYIGPTFLNNFTLSLNHEYLTYLDLSNTGMQDTQYINIVKNINQGILEVFIVQRNQITDYGIEQSQYYIANSSITYHDVSYNRLALCTDSLATIISSKKLLKIDVSGNDFSAVDFLPFWKASANGSSLVAFSASNAGINDLQLLDSIPYLGNTSIKEWVLSYNQFSDYGVTNFFYGLGNTTSNLIDFSGNLISDNCLSAIANVLPDIIDFYKLDLSYCDFTILGFESLTSVLPNTSINALVVCGNNIQNQGMELICEAVTHPDSLLVSIDVSNNGITHFNASNILSSDLESLTIDDNLLDAQTQLDFMQGLPSSSLHTINVRNTGMTTASANALAESLPDSNIEDFDISNNPDIGDEGMFSIAKALVRSVANKGRLGDKHINIDERRWLNHHAKPNSKVGFFDVSNTSMSDSSARAICRVLAPANISINDVSLLPNTEVDPSEVNLVNCRFNDRDQISQATTHFFAPARVQFNSLEVRALPALPGNSMNNTNMASSLVIGFAMVPPVILSILAIYFIYKAIQNFRNQPDINSVTETQDSRGESYAAATNMPI